MTVEKSRFTPSEDHGDFAAARGFRHLLATLCWNLGRASWAYRIEPQDSCYCWTCKGPCRG